MHERRAYWRHPRFHDVGLLDARFTHHRYDRHTHPTYVVASITEGCEHVVVGRRSIVAPAGTVLVVHPEEPHDGAPGLDGGWAYRTLYPTVELMTAVAAELGGSGAPMFPNTLIEDPALARSLAAAHAGSRSFDQVSAEASLLLALRHLIVGHSDVDRRREPIQGTGSQRRLRLYEDVIERDLSSDLDLQHLADAGGVTRFQVIRDFNKAVGLTPTCFIRDRRLRRASALLEQGTGIAEAAFAAGFADQSHLSRTFRAMLGITPSMFRKGLSVRQGEADGRPETGAGRPGRFRGG